MCGRYNFSKNSSSPMVQKVLENLQSRQVEVKTGEVNPGGCCCSHRQQSKAGASGILHEMGL